VLRALVDDILGFFVAAASSQDSHVVFGVSVLKAAGCSVSVMLPLTKNDTLNISRCFFVLVS
jgi:hypothetical protein